MSETVLNPRDAADVAEALIAHPRAVEVRGAGSKRELGHRVEADVLDLAALAGIVDYEPAELTLTARAATPLATIDAALAAHGQRLAFEPPDYGALLDASASATLGGVLAANVSGSRRVHAGAARDHFLGFHAVNGRGERYKAGGRVVKNVTGYDLPKLIAGSWGTLSVLTDVTVRVVPAPEAELTRVVECATAETAVALMTRALGAPLDVSCAAFDPARGVLLRLEGFAASVEARAATLREAADAEVVEELTAERSRALWSAHGGAAALADATIVWRISVAPSDAPRVLARIEPERCLLDWGGGLIWAAGEHLTAERVRGALDQGHAMLFKAPRERRGPGAAVFQPQPPAIAALSQRLKAAFDPSGKLNPGRMG